MTKPIKQTARQTYEILEKLRKMQAANPTVERAAQIEKMKIVADSLMDSEMAAKLKSFEAKHQGADWWQIMEANYPVIKDEARNSWVVTSKAREWENAPEWEFHYKYDALAKVQQLVRWIADGRRRGFGDVETDLEKFHAKFAA